MYAETSKGEVRQALTSFENLARKKASRQHAQKSVFKGLARSRWKLPHRKRQADSMHEKFMQDAREV